MNRVEREKMVRAMEMIARNVNDEELLESWLTVGVADGDIPYGKLELSEDFDEYYIDDTNFKNLMSVFLRTMHYAWKDGGLYCDGVVSCDKTDYCIE